MSNIRGYYEGYTDGYKDGRRVGSEEALKVIRQLLQDQTTHEDLYRELTDYLKSQGVY